MARGNASFALIEHKTVLLSIEQNNKHLNTKYGKHKKISMLDRISVIPTTHGVTDEWQLEDHTWLGFGWTEWFLGNLFTSAVVPMVTEHLWSADKSERNGVGRVRSLDNTSKW